MKIHTGCIFSLENLMIGSISTKQKVNARISTESELIGVDNRISDIYLDPAFWKCHGFKLK